MRTPHERLQAFLYILTRDHLPTGAVQDALQTSEHKEPSFFSLSIKKLTADWADRLIGKEALEPEYRFGVFGAEGDQIMTTPFRTAEGARAAASAGAHVRRGRITKRETVCRDEIEWEDAPV